jgi:hypothetical protein
LPGTNVLEHLSGWFQRNCLNINTVSCFTLGLWALC